MADKVLGAVLNCIEQTQGRSNYAAENEERHLDRRVEVQRNTHPTESNGATRLRQLASFAVWFFTLIVGAGLGAYFPQIVQWGRSIW